MNSESASDPPVHRFSPGGAPDDDTPEQVRVVVAEIVDSAPLPSGKYMVGNGHARALGPSSRPSFVPPPAPPVNHAPNPLIRPRMLKNEEQAAMMTAWTSAYNRRRTSMQKGIAKTLIKEAEIDTTEFVGWQQCVDDCVAAGHTFTIRDHDFTRLQTQVLREGYHAVCLLCEKALQDLLISLCNYMATAGDRQMLKFAVSLVSEKERHHTLTLDTREAQERRAAEAQVLAKMEEANNEEVAALKAELEALKLEDDPEERKALESARKKKQKAATVKLAGADGMEQGDAELFFDRIGAKPPVHEKPTEEEADEAPPEPSAE